MKKIVFVLCLVLLLAGCGSKGTQSVADGVPISGNIEDLMKLGKNYRCELQAKDGEQMMSGTTYLSGSSVRSDYQMKMGDKVYNGHAIVTGQTMYSWIDEMPEQAIKFNQADLTQSQNQTDETSSSASNYEDKYDYKCFTWTPDQSKFSVPTDIKFTDYSAMMKQLQGGSQNLNVNALKGDASMCKACDSISDASTKATCRQQLGCK